MLFLSKEASNKDERLKMEMLLSMNDDKAESSTERAWKENVSFGDQRTDLTIKEANFPENTFVNMLLQLRVGMLCILIL